MTDLINRGTIVYPTVQNPKYPNADEVIHNGLLEKKLKSAVDVLLVNPPSPDGGIWIRSQHRVGRRSRENMLWPQVSLAQMAAILHPTYRVKVIDAIAEHMSWKEFAAELDKCMPRYYITQVTAPTLENDMYGAFLAKERHAVTIAFGTHVTPVPRETMRSFPDLDFAIVGEPDLTVRDLIDHLERKINKRPLQIKGLFEKHDSKYETQSGKNGKIQLNRIKGLAWRNGSEIVINEARPFIPDLDDLPIPMHELLPLQKYRMPLIKGPFSFVVPSRGCPNQCIFCIKHVTYQYGVRLRSTDNIMKELWKLKKLGVNNVNMYSDLFTTNRKQVMELCKAMIEQNIKMKWFCNSRVDFVDLEMLTMMKKAGCWLIAWGLESGSEKVLKNARKGIVPEQGMKALALARKAGIKNWGYFIIGLPGETVDTIRETIDFSKKLPLDFALFHIAAPYPGTPFFFEVVNNKWFRKGTRWEQVDMDKETVLDYPNLSAEQLEYWQKRAFLEWVLRPGPILTFAKMIVLSPSTIHHAASAAVQHLKWALLGK
jgi:radical SAM superfamily enzyme YgiQ (UPF0313 family)